MKKLSMAKYKRIVFCATAACAFFALGLASASAQAYVAPPYVPPIYVPEYDRGLGFYFNGDLGPSFMPNFQSSRFGFPGTFSPRPGVRLGAEPGFNFMATDGLTLGAEFETGVIYNYLHNVWGPGLSQPIRGDYYQVPLLGNLEFKLHPDSFVVPYFGVGAGGDYSWARIRTPGFFGSGFGSPPPYFESHDDRIDPAVQGMGGVRFRINSFGDVGVGYKFLADFPNSGKYIATHAVVATFTVRF
jgi:hypothetical protein